MQFLSYAWILHACIWCMHELFMQELSACMQVFCACSICAWTNMHQIMHIYAQLNLKKPKREDSLMPFCMCIKNLFKIVNMQMNWFILLLQFHFTWKLQKFDVSVHLKLYIHIFVPIAKSFTFVHIYRNMAHWITITHS